MKYLSLLALLMAGSVSLFAQSTKPKAPAKPVMKPAAPKVVLKTFNDSVSYAIGYSAASFYKQQGLTKINTNMVSAGINDILSGKPTLLDEFSANMVMNKMMSNVLEAKSKPNIDSGAAFLAKNKKRAGVITTASGLQYEILRQGDGIKPTENDTFVVHYRGTLLNGTEFDGSYNRGQPLTHPMNRVIKGWTEGLQLMNVGTKFKLYVPYELGYGPADNGPIPGGSMMIFEMELLDVKKMK